MSEKKHTPEPIIARLREAAVELVQRATLAQVWRRVWVTEQAYYRWRAALEQEGCGDAR